MFAWADEIFAFSGNGRSVPLAKREGVLQEHENIRVLLSAVIDKEDILCVVGYLHQASWKWPRGSVVCTYIQQLSTATLLSLPSG